MDIEQFEQTIREFGIEEACLYFGYKKGDWFIEKMKQSLAPIQTEPINPPIAEPVQENAILDLSQYDDYIQVWTDGACPDNGNANAVGGYGAVLVYKGKEKPIWGFKKQATNQEMELFAVSEALKQITNNNMPVVVFSDSDYVVRCFTEKWFEKWNNNGWINANNKPVAHKNLWEILIKIYLAYQLAETDFKFVHVPAHSGLKYNEQADALAKKAVNEGMKLGK